VAQLSFILNQNTKVTDEFRNAKPDPAPKKGLITSASAKKAVKDYEHFGDPGERFKYGPLIYDNVIHDRNPGDGLGGKVDPGPNDIIELVTDVRAQFKNKPAGKPVTACPVTVVQTKVSGEVLPKSNGGDEPEGGL